MPNNECLTRIEAYPSRAVNRKEVSPPLFTAAGRVRPQLKAMSISPGQMLEMLKQGDRKALEGGTSGQVFLLRHGDRKFVVRRYSDPFDAACSAALMQQLAPCGFLPRLLGLCGNELLVEFIGGRVCRKEDRDRVAYEVGELCAVVNCFEPWETYDPDVRFTEHLQTLLRVGYETAAHPRILAACYRQMRERITPELVLDLSDLHPGNFMLQGEQLKLIDIGALRPRYRGFGLARGACRWFRRPRARDLFQAGYEASGQFSFPSADYLRFLILSYCVASLATQLRHGRRLSPRVEGMLAQLVLAEQGGRDEK